MVPITTKPPAACPHCDSTLIAQLPRITGESHVTWFRCAGCGRLFNVPTEAARLIKT